VTFQVEVTDSADAEIEAAFLRLNEFNPDSAGRWLEGLLRAIEGLAEFPRMHPIAPESEILRTEVRRMLYGKKRSAYRVLFTVIDADSDGAEDTVRVLFVRHSARRPMWQSNAEGSA
jgi:plasmid stabilization system protein ParE